MIFPQRFHHGGNVFLAVALVNRVLEHRERGLSCLKVDSTLRGFLLGAYPRSFAIRRKRELGVKFSAAARSAILLTSP
jgi:hypothetical protein